MASRASTCTAPDTFVPKTQTTSPTTARFQRFSTRWSVFWAPHHPKLRPQSLKTGGMTPSKAPTRRRHAARGLRMAQNPHYRPNRRPPHGLLGEDSPLTAAMRYKRRQSEPKNQYFQRKRRRIDDVCNNHTRIPTKTPRIDDVCNKTQAGPPNRRPPRGLRGQAAVPVGGGGAWPGFESTRRSATQPHWCGGRRRDRRARAGFEARRRTK